jgi:hypothetical protein
MPTTICTAFKRNCQPCGSRVNHETGLCGIHRQLVANPGLRARFEHDQAIYRDAWERIQAGTHHLVGNHLRRIETEDAVPVAPPPARALCGHVMKNGRPCTRTAGEHGKCGMHHSLDVRHAEDVPMKAAIREAKRMWRMQATVVAIDNYVTVVSAGLVERCRRELRHVVSRMVVAPFYDRIHFLVHNGATLEQLLAHVDGWVADGALTERRGMDVAVFAQGVIRNQQWRQAHPPAPMFRPDQRVAQLAHDNQNVHTPEITKQMKDSLDILLAVEVPVTQVDTCREILASWTSQGRPQAEIHTVYVDMVSWWNRTLVYKPNDKLYKKCLRGLWFTIKSYKGEVRAELEKRLWDECRDAAIPYTVCTQGHMARLSNVMVGFDDAFVPPIPVGEILQQKMAAISAMDIEYDEQIEMAEQVLAELKIPHEEHKNWLAAF